MAWAAARRREAEAFRAADPVERAATALRRRGNTVWRAEVDGGPAGRWRVNRASSTLSDAELVALAQTRAGFRP